MVLIMLQILTCAYKNCIETLNITIIIVDLKFEELCIKLLQ